MPAFGLRFEKLPRDHRQPVISFSAALAEAGVAAAELLELVRHEPLTVYMNGDGVDVVDLGAFTRWVHRARTYAVTAAAGAAVRNAVRSEAV